MASPSSDSRRNGFALMLLAVTGVGILCATLFAANRVAAQQQSSAASATFDPLQVYVGTWIARARSGDKSIDCVSLKLNEASGQLTGTLSHFGLSLFADGQDLPSPCAAGDDPIKNVRFDDGLGDFVIGADSDEVRLIPEGTDVIHLTFLGPSSAPSDAARADQQKARLDEELKFMNEWHASSFSPDAFMIRLHDRAAPASFSTLEAAGSSTAFDEALWPAQYALVLINTSEARFRFKHGAYTDYSELVTLGLLEQTAASAFKGTLGLDLQSPVAPKKGWKVSVLLGPDRLSYTASIVLERQRKCDVRFSSHEAGMISEERLPGCSQN